jgi:DNA invertase Pin-like site-specific DNA recombinase
MLIGYARTFTEDQGFEAQVAALEAEGCEKLFRERVSSASERDQLEAALDWAREGDTFVVTTMDRLARSAQHLLEIVESLERKRVALRLLDFAGHRVDTHSRQGKLVLRCSRPSLSSSASRCSSARETASPGLMADARDASPPPWPKLTR